MLPSLALALSLSGCHPGPALETTITPQSTSTPFTEGNAFFFDGVYQRPTDLIYRHGDVAMFGDALTLDHGATWFAYNLAAWGEPTGRPQPLDATHSVWTTDAHGLILLDHSDGVVYDLAEPGVLGDVATDPARGALFFAGGDALYRLEGTEWRTMELPAGARAAKIARTGDLLLGMAGYGTASSSAWTLDLVTEVASAISPPPTTQSTAGHLVGSPDGIYWVNERAMVRWDGASWVNVALDPAELALLEQRAITVCPDGSVLLGSDIRLGDPVYDAPGLRSPTLEGPYSPVAPDTGIQIGAAHCDAEGLVLVGSSSFAHSFFVEDDHGLTFAVERPNHLSPGTGRGAGARLLDTDGGYWLHTAGNEVLWDGANWRPYASDIANIEIVDGQLRGTRQEEDGVRVVWSTDGSAWTPGELWPTWPGWTLPDGTRVALAHRVERIQSQTDATAWREITYTDYSRQAAGSSAWELVYEGATECSPTFSGTVSCTDTGPDGGAVVATHGLEDGRLASEVGVHGARVSSDAGETWIATPTLAEHLFDITQTDNGGRHDLNLVGYGPRDVLILSRDSSPMPDGSIILHVVADAGLGEELEPITLLDPGAGAWESFLDIRSLTLGRRGQVLGFSGRPHSSVFETEPLWR